jgi:hypothetical protein
LYGRFVNVDEREASTIAVFIPFRKEAYTSSAARRVMLRATSVLFEKIRVHCGIFENNHECGWNCKEISSQIENWVTHIARIDTYTIIWGIAQEMGKVSSPYFSSHLIRCVTQHFSGIAQLNLHLL